MKSIFNTLIKTYRPFLKLPKNHMIVIGGIILCWFIVLLTCMYCLDDRVTLKTLHKHVAKQNAKQDNQVFEPIVVQNVLTPKEIDDIKNSVEFSVSETIGAETNVENKSVRVSENGWYENPKLITKLIKAIDPKKSPEHCEKMQVVRYRKGGFFKPHYDSIANPHENHNWDFAQGGHREYTLLIALCNPSEYNGGYTVFPNLNKKYKLKKGNGLLFRNVDHKDGMLSEFQHGGDPVLSGEKIICNLWSHVKPYNNSV